MELYLWYLIYISLSLFYSSPRLHELVWWISLHLRAPVLVALALIEGGMKYEDAVQFIRQ